MKKKNGVVETYYDNGQLKSRGLYKDDKPSGLYEGWYENGQLKSRINYENGKPDGLWETWNENGQLRESTMYKDGIAVEQENDKNVIKEELLQLDRKILALKIMVLRDRQVAREITFKESLKQSVSLIEEYDKR